MLAATYFEEIGLRGEPFHPFRILLRIMISKILDIGVRCPRYSVLVNICKFILVLT